MATPLQQTAAMDEELARLRKNKKVICIRNINFNGDTGEFEEACRQRLTLSGDIKFLWPAPNRKGRRNSGMVFLGFDSRPDCNAALEELKQGFDFRGLKVIVQRSGKGSKAQNQVAIGSTATSASTPAPAPAPAPSENQPEAQMVAHPSADQVISAINTLAATPAHLVAQVSGRARLSEATATLLAANPETARILLKALLFPTATIATSSSSIIPVLGASPIEEPTTSATSCNTIQLETIAVQSGDTTMQSDKEDTESEPRFPGTSVADDPLSDVDY